MSLGGSPKLPALDHSASCYINILPAFVGASVLSDRARHVAGLYEGVTYDEASEAVTTGSFLMGTAGASIAVGSPATSDHSLVTSSKSLESVLEMPSAARPLTNASSKNGLRRSSIASSLNALSTMESDADLLASHFLLATPGSSVIPVTPGMVSDQPASTEDLMIHPFSDQLEETVQAFDSSRSPSPDVQVSSSYRASSLPTSRTHSPLPAQMPSHGSYLNLASSPSQWSLNSQSMSLLPSKITLFQSAMLSATADALPADGAADPGRTSRHHTLQMHASQTLPPARSGMLRSSSASSLMMPSRLPRWVGKQNGAAGTAAQHAASGAAAGLATEHRSSRLHRSSDTISGMDDIVDESCRPDAFGSLEALAGGNQSLKSSTEQLMAADGQRLQQQPGQAKKSKGSVVSAGAGTAGGVVHRQPAKLKSALAGPRLGSLAVLGSSRSPGRHGRIPAYTPLDASTGAKASATSTPSKMFDGASSLASSRHDTAPKVMAPAAASAAAGSAAAAAPTVAAAGVAEPSSLLSGEQLLLAASSIAAELPPAILEKPRSVGSEKNEVSTLGITRSWDTPEERLQQQGKLLLTGRASIDGLHLQQPDRRSATSKLPETTVEQLIYQPRFRPAVVERQRDPMKPADDAVRDAGVERSEAVVAQQRRGSLSPQTLDLNSRPIKDSLGWKSEGVRLSKQGVPEHDTSRRVPAVHGHQPREASNIRPSKSPEQPQRAGSPRRTSQLANGVKEGGTLIRNGDNRQAAMPVQSYAVSKTSPRLAKVPVQPDQLLMDPERRERGEATLQESRVSASGSIGALQAAVNPLLLRANLRRSVSQPRASPSKQGHPASSATTASTDTQSLDVLAELQQSYADLLTKYALAEVTIDQLRLGTKLKVDGLPSSDPTHQQLTTPRVHSVTLLSMDNFSERDFGQGGRKMSIGSGSGIRFAFKIKALDDDIEQLWQQLVESGGQGVVSAVPRAKYLKLRAALAELQQEHGSYQLTSAGELTPSAAAQSNLRTAQKLQLMTKRLGEIDEELQRFMETNGASDGLSASERELAESPDAIDRMQNSNGTAPASGRPTAGDTPYSGKSESSTRHKTEAVGSLGAAAVGSHIPAVMQKRSANGQRGAQTPMPVSGDRRIGSRQTSAARRGGGSTVADPRTDATVAASDQDLSDDTQPSAKHSYVVVQPTTKEHAGSPVRRVAETGLLLASSTRSRVPTEVSVHQATGMAGPRAGSQPMQSQKSQKHSSDASSRQEASGETAERKGTSADYESKYIRGTEPTEIPVGLQAGGAAEISTATGAHSGSSHPLRYQPSDVIATGQMSSTALLAQLTTCVEPTLSSPSENVYRQPDMRESLAKASGYRTKHSFADSSRDLNQVAAPAYFRPEGMPVADAVGSTESAAVAGSHIPNDRLLISTYGQLQEVAALLKGIVRTPGASPAAATGTSRADSRPDESSTPGQRRRQKLRDLLGEVLQLKLEMAASESPGLNDTQSAHEKRSINNVKTGRAAGAYKMLPHKSAPQKDASPPIATNVDSLEERQQQHRSRKRGDDRQSLSSTRRLFPSPRSAVDADRRDGHPASTKYRRSGDASRNRAADGSGPPASATDASSSDNATTSDDVVSRSPRTRTVRRRISRPLSAADERLTSVNQENYGVASASAADRLPRSLQHKPSDRHAVAAEQSIRSRRSHSWGDYEVRIPPSPGEVLPSSAQDYCDRYDGGTQAPSVRRSLSPATIDRHADQRAAAGSFSGSQRRRPRSSSLGWERQECAEESSSIRFSPRDASSFRSYGHYRDRIRDQSGDGDMHQTVAEAFDPAIADREARLGFAYLPDSTQWWWRRQQQRHASQDDESLRPTRWQQQQKQQRGATWARGHAVRPSSADGALVDRRRRVTFDSAGWASEDDAGQRGTTHGDTRRPTTNGGSSPRLPADLSSSMPTHRPLFRLGVPSGRQWPQSAKSGSPYNDSQAPYSQPPPEWEARRTAGEQLRLAGRHPDCSSARRERSFPQPEECVHHDSLGMTGCDDLRQQQRHVMSRQMNCSSEADVSWPTVDEKHSHFRPSVASWCDAPVSGTISHGGLPAHSQQHWQQQEQQRILSEVCQQQQQCRSPSCCDCFAAAATQQRLASRGRSPETSGEYADDLLQSRIPSHGDECRRSTGCAACYSRQPYTPAAADRLPVTLASAAAPVAAGDMSAAICTHSPSAANVAGGPSLFLPPPGYACQGHTSTKTVWAQPASQSQPLLNCAQHQIPQQDETLWRPYVASSTGSSATGIAHTRASASAEQLVASTAAPNGTTSFAASHHAPSGFSTAGVAQQLQSGKSALGGVTQSAVQQASGATAAGGYQLEPVAYVTLPAAPPHGNPGSYVVILPVTQGSAESWAPQQQQQQQLYLRQQSPSVTDSPRLQQSHALSGVAAGTAVSATGQQAQPFSKPGSMPRRMSRLTTLVDTTPAAAYFTSRKAMTRKCRSFDSVTEASSEDSLRLDHALTGTRHAASRVLNLSCQLMASLEKEVLATSPEKT